MKVQGFGGLLVAAGVLAGCTQAVPPRSQAAAVEQMQCGTAEQATADMKVLETASVIAAEPLYSHVITGNNGMENRVDGAKLLIVPPAGVTADQMTRLLQCHSARALLGKVDRAQFPDDPFWLPNAWVSVEVRPENGNYAVVLEANDVPGNLKLAAHAKAFAGTHALPPRAVQ